MRLASRPDQIRAGIEALTARSGTSEPGTSEPGPGNAEVEARLRELALHLASYPDLRVSVIIYEDGSAELEVLHAGPPHHTEATIDRGKFTGQPDAESGWVVDLTGDSALERATDLIRGTLRAASTS